MIADKVIAARFVARRHVHNSGAQPASVISAALPDASIIGIGNALIVAVSPYDDTP